MTNTFTLETEIDRLVYQLYNLNEDEIAIVEGNVGKTAASIVHSEKNHKNESTLTNPDAQIVKSTPLVDVPVLVKTQATPLQSDYGMYKCSECGKIVMGFAKEGHKHPGKVVDWNKVGK